MSDIPARLRTRVIRRAENRCEYCRLSQQGQEAEFHVDHVVPRVADGPTVYGNLALACVSCSLREGSQQEATDLDTGKVVPLFNPRRQSWEDHFRWEGMMLIGRSATGTATIAALQMNRPRILEIRAVEAQLGRHP